MGYVNHLFSVPCSHQREKIASDVWPTLHWIPLRLVYNGYVLVIENEHIIEYIFCEIEVHLDMVNIFVAYQQLLQT